MKKTKLSAYITALIIAILLCGCEATQTPSAPSSSAVTQSSASDEAISDITSNDSSSQTTPSNEDEKGAEQNASANENSLLPTDGATPTKYAVADLDGDRKNEVVLWLETDSDEYYGFTVVHKTGGKVKEYNLWYRAFNQLKTDGTFSFSSGAADSGFGKMTFTAGSYSIIKLAHSVSAENDSLEPTVKYYINSNETTEAEFDKAIDAQSAKSDVAWLEYDAQAVVSALN